MDTRVILQVPLSKSLKEQAEATASDYGFSSLQEIIRVLLKKLAKRELTLSVTQNNEEEIVHLSPAAEKRYKKAVEDIKAGRNITKTENTDELLKLLRA